MWSFFLPTPRGREERFEDTFELIRRDAAAGVGDGNGSITPYGFCDKGAALGRLAAMPTRNRQPSVALHGIPRVHGHVDDGGFELAGVGVDKARLFRAKDDDLDARADQGADHFGQRLHASPDLEHLRLQRLPPREGQQLPGQLRGAGHGIASLRYSAAAVAPAGRAAAAGHGSEDHVSRLLKSCATPPVSWPSASSRWPCFSASSAARRFSASK